MRLISYWAMIMALLIVSCLNGAVHASVGVEEQQQTHYLSALHRNWNHHNEHRSNHDHAHAHDQQQQQHITKITDQQQFNRILQQRVEAQRRRRLHRRLDDPLMSSGTNVVTETVSNNNNNSNVQSHREGEALAQRHKQLQQMSTRLRRLNAGRSLYNSNNNNNVAQRRLKNRGDGNSQWKYHVYNVQSNTFEAATPPPGRNTVGGNGYGYNNGNGNAHGNGKGDDNTNDVEFIDQTATDAAKPNWNRRGFGFGFMPTHTTAAPPATRPPPPLVPARRGYVTSAPPLPPSSNADQTPPSTTYEPVNETKNMDSREMEKRHICVQQRTVTMPVKTTEVYTRPIWKHVNTPCSAVQIQTQHPNQMCTRVQLVHEQGFRDVIRHKSSQQITYDCCSGWERDLPQSDACMKPICTTPCQNGGTCIAPDTCGCGAGFTGAQCQYDVNECKEEKPCDQSCINTIGSYYCRCREGFVLQADQQSCKKNDLHHDDAFEARDLENDIDSSVNADMTARLQKIERSLANERVHTNELQKSLQATYSVVDTLKTRLSTIEKQQQDINRLQSNLYATESRTNKLEGMLNLLIKCRNTPNAYCP